MAVPPKEALLVGGAPLPALLGDATRLATVLLPPPPPTAVGAAWAGPRRFPGALRSR